jgi:phage terminase Nu1 subunit (DNA packaging protein)
MMTLPKTVSTEDLATLLDIDPRTVGKLVSKDVFRRLKHGTHDLVDSVQSYLAYRETVVSAENEKGEYGQARIDLYKEKIALLRMDRAEREKNTVRATEVILWMTTVIKIFTTALLSLPAKLAPRLTGIKENGKIESIIRNELIEVLNGLQSLFQFVDKEARERMGLNPKESKNEHTTIQ